MFYFIKIKDIKARERSKKCPKMIKLKKKQIELRENNF